MSAAEAFATCARLRQVHLDWFAAAGVSGFGLLGYLEDPAAAGIVAHQLVWRGRPAFTPGFEVRQARVQFLRGSRFVFADDRRAEADALVPAFVIPAIEDDELLDLVAWHPKTGRLASLNRHVGVLIGPVAPTADEPLLVFPDPLAWLAACRRGAVIVHESLARPFLLDQPALQAADVAHGESLQAMLAKVRLPRIVVPTDSIARVAA